ncbi:sugar ABC transporter permease [Vibrio nigripulchritudo]|uniref:sugar ABC transporter permease n=1 Tax=Vibrio nigripulchritudo TaxID=28173 RepID=UPI0009BBE129|nr:ABC transporter permease [Vibrio nigripulchritudo]
MSVNSTSSTNPSNTSASAKVSQPKSGSNPPAKRVNWFERIRNSRFGNFVPVLFALFAIWTYFGITEPAFLSARNFYFLFMQSSVVGILAVGITVLLLLGDIDLSVAATAGVCAAILAVLTTNMGVPAPLACLVAIGAGVLLSMFQGSLVAYIGIPSFVVTLAGLLGFQGLMLKILGIHGAINVRDPFIRGITTTSLPDWLGWVLVAVGILLMVLMATREYRLRQQMGLEQDSVSGIAGKVLFFAVLAGAAVMTLNSYKGVPLVVLILFGVTLLFAWITTSTPFGRALFAVGGNPESARRVGISLNQIKIAAFAITGLMAALGGIIGASRYASVSFNAFAGGPLLLDAIGAAVIGGTSLFGGRGSVWNAILGALVIGSLGNGLDLSGASAADKLMFSGAILLIAVSIDALSRKTGKA